MLQAQREFILERVKLNVNSQTVYDPLAKDFKVNLEGVSRINHANSSCHGDTEYTGSGMDYV
jgi:hypothetical protein